MPAAERRWMGFSVFDAAKHRIREALEHSDKAYVSFSGGKDSTVMLDIVMREAVAMGKRVGVLFVDLEAQYQHTVDHVGRTLDKWSDHVDPYWVALPMTLRNAVSQYEPQWMCWEPGREQDWVRQAPSRAITDEQHFPFFERGMEFEDFVPKFAEWYAGSESAVCFVGIRTQESLNRWRTIASSTKTRVREWPWSTKVTKHTWNAYPIYDWKTEDIWTYHAAVPDMPRNEVYDLMHRAGLTIHQARICQPYGDDQRKGLWLYHLVEPQTWSRVVARVNGANQGALYATERGNILGQHKVTRPEGHTWESFAGLLLGSMPAPTAEHYRAKIGIFLEWYRHRGYQDGIPDEADLADEAARREPSWRRICKTLLRNDYWCKGLSFTQHKSSASYARYRKLIAKKKRNGCEIGPGVAWNHACGPDKPGRPTSKQLALLAAMTGGSTPEHAWVALGRHLGISPTECQERATRSDASALIEGMKASDIEYRTEKYTHAPKGERGTPVATLGESGK